MVDKALHFSTGGNRACNGGAGSSAADLVEPGFHFVNIGAQHLDVLFGLVLTGDQVEAVGHGVGRGGIFHGGIHLFWGKGREDTKKATR